MWENNVPSSKMKANKKITQRTKKNDIFQPSFGKKLLIQAKNSGKIPNNLVLNLPIYGEPLQTFYSFENQTVQDEGKEQGYHQGGGN